MYIIKLQRGPFLIRASVWSKEWQEDINSHLTDMLAEKTFLLHFRARQWAHSVIAANLFKKRKLEVIDG